MVFFSGGSYIVNVRVSLCGLGKCHISPHFSESGVQLDALSCLEAVNPKNRKCLVAVKVQKHHLYISQLAVQIFFQLLRCL